MVMIIDPLASNLVTKTQRMSVMTALCCGWWQSAGAGCAAKVIHWIDLTENWDGVEIRAR